MAMRKKTAAAVLTGLLLGGALCTAGALAAPVVHDAHRQPPAPEADHVAYFAARSAGEPAPADESADAWVSPAEGEISSGFGDRWGSVHNGVDIANDIGTPIRAAARGTVIDSGPASGYGMWIRIAHSSDVVSIYGHIDEDFVEVGEQVRAGQQIATMGDRGESTGPHLHFQLEVAGKPVDPKQFYRAADAELTHP
ncbi:Peptidase family M23 [Saccharopolyspora shandongensis]|uniref:Peptidase family M23 n=1 Tax=Saccharopolyspora shandongensis TaxID=418495 RepID=A0A1H3HDY3_9PSEU|nr:M23 family metallopeptidase [Saccharopolyspora shandongensis]SDY12859.1 Peptidase family M23 [Saccharopolyspora shandongensis]